MEMLDTRPGSLAQPLSDSRPLTITVDFLRYHRDYVFKKAIKAA
jgi:hypothetical protein